MPSFSQRRKAAADHCFLRSLSREQCPTCTCQQPQHDLAHRAPKSTVLVVSYSPAAFFSPLMQRLPQGPLLSQCSWPGSKRQVYQPVKHQFLKHCLMGQVTTPMHEHTGLLYIYTQTMKTFPFKRHSHSEKRSIRPGVGHLWPAGSCP